MGEITKVSELEARLAAVPPLRLNYNHLMVFLDVAEAGSINAAAEVRCVAQSAVSRIVRELELSLKCTLLQRHARGIEITGGGQIIVDLARKIRAEGYAACRDLSFVRSGSRPVSVAVGIPPGFVGFTAQALVRFAEYVPGCRIILREGPKDTLLAAVAAGELDVVVGRVGDNDLAAGLREEFVYHDALVVLAACGYPTARPGVLSAADVQRGSWILPPTDAAPYQDVVACLQSLRLPVPAAKIETTSLMLIKELLLSGRDWLAVMPRDLFRAELGTHRLQIFGKDSSSMLQPMGVVLRRRAVGTEASYVAKFVECLKEASSAAESRQGNIGE